MSSLTCSHMHAAQPPAPSSEEYQTLLQFSRGRALTAAMHPKLNLTSKLSEFLSPPPTPYCSLQGLIPQAQSKKPVSGSMQVSMLCRMAKVWASNLPERIQYVSKLKVFMQAAVHGANMYAAAGVEHVSLSFEADDLSSSDFSGHLTDHADIIEDAQEAQWP